VDEERLSRLKNLSLKREAPPQEGVPRPRLRWKTRVLVPGLVLGGLAALLAATAYDEIIPAPEVQAVPVVVKKTQAGQAAGTVVVQAAGWIEADPYKSYVTALADGVVSEVVVLEGEPIKKGQVVVRLVSDDARLAYEASEAQVREAEASLESARADLVAAQTEWENPVERKRAIEVYEASLSETSATLEQLAAEIVVEESKLEHAKSEYDRGGILHQSSSISEAHLIRLRSEFNAQRAKLEATKRRHAATKELVAKYEAELRAAKEFMRLRIDERLKLERAQAAVAKAEASLSQARTAFAEAKLRLERMEVRSPMDGIVMRRLTEPGSKAIIKVDNPGSARVLSLYDPNRLQVRVDVPLADAAKVGVGQSAEVLVEVLPDRTFAGMVTRVLHEANIQKNTLEVKVALTNPEPMLRPEMLARVRFLARQEGTKNDESERVFAPESAVRREAGASSAWVVRDYNGRSGIAEARPLQLGATRSEGWIEVINGLRAGDLVVARSTSELKNGRKVRVITE